LQLNDTINEKRRSKGTKIKGKLEKSITPVHNAL
jgi:hypothetical protein